MTLPVSNSRVSGRPALQWQRLVVQHCPDGRPGGLLRNAMMGEEIVTFGHDEIDILEKLQPLVMVRIGDAHAGADHFKHIDDLEWPIALMGAQLAVIDVID